MKFRGGKESNTVDCLDKIRELNNHNSTFKYKTKALNKKVINDKDNENIK